jgi:hypothetical protein
MRYEPLELPKEPWVLRLALAHHVSAEGEIRVNDSVSARRPPAGKEFKLWQQLVDQDPELIAFPEPLVINYFQKRLQPLIDSFHSLSGKVSGLVLSAPEAADLACFGVNVGLLADIEIWGVKEKVVEVDFWVEAPKDEGHSTVRLLYRLVTDAENFPRRVFRQTLVPTELNSEGRALKEVADSDNWISLRGRLGGLSGKINDFLATLPDAPLLSPPTTAVMEVYEPDGKTTGPAPIFVPTVKVKPQPATPPAKVMTPKRRIRKPDRPASKV